jgi:hypothetical protein
MELFKANSQWSTRPADERFESLETMFNATQKYAKESVESRVAFEDLRVEAVDKDIRLVGRQNIPARFTNWAFGQLCSRIAAPASYLRDLPPTLAAQNLNHGLAQRAKDKASNSIANLMFHRNGDMLLRSILTDDYSRIWNWEVIDRLRGLEADYGWKPAKPTSHWGADTVGTCIMCQGSGKDRDEAACMYCAGTGKELPALYASDHDMFAFLLNDQLTVDEKGSDGAIYKGVIVENSEVGASSLKLTRFLFREMCGNHIIWGASRVVDLKVRHVGNARSKWAAYYSAVRSYAAESVNEIEAKIASSKLVKIGTTKDEVLDTLFGKKAVHGLSRVTLEAGYKAVNEEQDGDANSAWGFVQGLTRHSQSLGFADKRTEVDRAAGKILDLF